ncbi:MAG TPA: hypothetical protein VLK34_07205 [Nocardioidaceae bacterium]|nr:hypothetical protein [Nocardioidaceae bacterium]
MRVYLAATRERLRALAGGANDGEEWTGFAPLDAVRAELGQLGDEELEYALSIAAGEASAALGADESRPSRRFVVVAEVDGGAVVADPDVPGAVFVHVPLALSDVDAILAEDQPGGGGELGWFGVQEIADLLA